MLNMMRLMKKKQIKKKIIYCNKCKCNEIFVAITYCHRLYYNSFHQNLFIAIGVYCNNLEFILVILFEGCLGLERAVTIGFCELERQLHHIIYNVSQEMSPQASLSLEL